MKKLTHGMYHPRHSTHEGWYSRNHKMWKMKNDGTKNEEPPYWDPNKSELIDIPNKSKPVDISEKVLLESTTIIEDICKLFMDFNISEEVLLENTIINEDIYKLLVDSEYGLRFRSYLAQTRHQKIKKCRKYAIDSESDFLKYIFRLFIKISKEIKRNYNIKRQGLEIIPKELPFAGIRKDLIDYKLIIEKSQLMDDNIKTLYQEAFILLNELEYITNIELEL